MGYTQEEFAEKVGIGYSSLKKYISGKNAYTYEILDRFATELDCSYDYLLGKSKSPNREYHEITEQTRLSEKAIEKIVYYAKHYDDNDRARIYILILNLLLQEEGLFECIAGYLTAGKTLNSMQSMLHRYSAETLNKALEENLEKVNKSPEDEIFMDKEMGISFDTFLLVDIINKFKSVKPEVIAMITKELSAKGSAPIDMLRQLDSLIGKQEER